MKIKLMLAITKIGDLLLENKITSLEEKPEWKDIYLDIPSYQRPYKWTTKNVNQLIDDIDESMKAEKELYRVGTLILHKHVKDMFKGISVKDNYPYAQYYKGAFSYAEDFNHSSMSFVTGIQKLRPFQLNAPIVAGKPFFEYTKYYFDILADIQNIVEIYSDDADMSG